MARIGVWEGPDQWFKYRRCLFTTSTRLRKSICRRNQLQKINQTLTSQRELRPICCQSTPHYFASQLTSPKRPTTHRRGPCYFPRRTHAELQNPQEFHMLLLPFFDAAFNSKSIEGESNVPELDDTPHEVFGIFVNWLYMQKNQDKVRLWMAYPLHSSDERLAAGW